LITSRSRRCLLVDQLVQPSVAGEVVTVPEPPVAVTPVSEGIEKNVFSQAAGAVVAILASLVSVTVSGLFELPLAPTTRAVVRECELPEVPVA
jgi:hypothetical protein